MQTGGKAFSLQEGGGGTVSGFVRSCVVLADEAEEVSVSSHLDIETDVGVVHDKEGEGVGYRGKFLGLNSESVSRVVSILAFVAVLNTDSHVRVNSGSRSALVNNSFKVR